MIIPWFLICLWVKDPNYQYCIGLAYFPWASYQIREIAGCACACAYRERFPRHHSKLSRHASRHVRDRYLTRNPWVSCQIAATHVPWCMPESLTRHRWRGKRFRDYRRMRKPQFYVSDKRPMEYSENQTALVIQTGLGSDSCAGWTDCRLISPEQNGRHLADDNSRCIFVNEKFCLRD